MAKHISIGVQLVTPPSDIARYILKECEVVVNKAALITEFRIRPFAIQKMKEAIKNCPEVQSLQGGQLQAELGPTDAEVSQVINNVINELVNTLEISFRPANASASRQIKLDLTLKIFPFQSVQVLVNSIGASFLTKKGVNIPWLDWLLTYGDTIVVKDYIISTSYIGNSRTGTTVMRKAKGRGWRVPPQFSGIEQDNFITRALDSVAEEIVNELVDTFERNVQ